MKMEPEALFRNSLFVIAAGIIIFFASYFLDFLYWISFAIVAIGICIMVYSIAMKGLSKDYKMGAEIVPLIAMTMIVAGIIINVICSIYFRDLVGIGNHLFFWGFVLAVISFFFYAVKDRMK